MKSLPGENDGAQTRQLKEMIRKHDPKITISDSLEGATHAFVWVKPKQDFMKRNQPLRLGAEREFQKEIVEIQKKVPTITAIRLEALG